MERLKIKIRKNKHNRSKHILTDCCLINVNEKCNSVKLSETLSILHAGGCEIVARIWAETNKIPCTLGCNIWGVNLDPSAIRINIKVISPQKEERGVGKVSELEWMSSRVRDKSWTIMFLLSLLLIITQRLVAVARSKIFPQSGIFSNLRDLITSQCWMGGCDVDWE